MNSHPTCHAETVERHIRRMSMLSGGFVFEVSVTMTKLHELVNALII